MARPCGAVREDRERQAEIEPRKERWERQKASNPVLEREVEHGSESGLSGRFSWAESDSEPSGEGQGKCSETVFWDREFYVSNGTWRGENDGRLSLRNSYSPRHETPLHPFRAPRRLSGHCDYLRGSLSCFEPRLIWLEQDEVEAYRQDSESSGL
jgi:hypothetical protein